MQAEPQALAGALLDPQCYPHATESIERVETHISWVFLTGELAYKVKKPVKLPFLDFTSLAARKHFCEQELTLNRRLAPELYLEVVPIGGTQTAPRIGATPAIDYAVKMRQFPAAARLDRALAAGTVGTEALLAFGTSLAQFHRELPALRDEPDAHARRVVLAARDNLRELGELLSAGGDGEATRAGDGEAAHALAAISAWTDARCAQLEPTFAARVAAGARKDCHGDMHLENLLELEGRVLAFDALEFDPALRQTDVMSEAAFVAMDLMAHERAALSYRFLTRYLEASGDYDGVAVLRFYLVYRAAVRAKVRALAQAREPGPNASDRAQPPGAGDRPQEPPVRAKRAATPPDESAYLALARTLVRPRRPLLLITHGLSASGKTQLSEHLIGRMPALRVRSDLERKRLLGLAPDAATESAVGGGAYTNDSSARTYERLRAVAGTILGDGFDAIVDAAFLRLAERMPFRALATERGARFAILDCTASEDALRRRITARAAARSDASEATTAVLDWQLAHRDPLTSEELTETLRVDTEQRVDFEALARQLLEA